MQTTRIAIVGASLSGLYAAYLLERKGVRDAAFWAPSPARHI